MKAIIVSGARAVLALSTLGCGDVADDVEPTSPGIGNEQGSPGVRPSALQSVFHPIKSAGTNLCLQPDPADPRSNYATIVQMPCENGNLAQFWKEQRVGPGRYMFINQLSGLCMNAQHSGDKLFQFECTRSNSDQEFNTKVDLPAVTIIESRTGFTNTGICVDIPYNSTQVGLAAVLFLCSGTPQQSFVIGFSL